MQVKMIPARVETVERVIEPAKVQIELSVHQAEILGSILSRCNASVLNGIYDALQDSGVEVNKYPRVISKAIAQGARITHYEMIDLYSFSEDLKE